MKKQTKGVIFTILFGGGLLFWATAASMPDLGVGRSDVSMEDWTPEHNFPEEQREQFCGTDEAQSTEFIQEYRIPTVCSQPLAIVTDPQGDVWFAQTNTGNIAKFDPESETFTEYDNEQWPAGARSMMWGMDYAPDGTLWYTDEAYDVVWIFSTVDKTYSAFQFPQSEETFPQRIQISGSQAIVNDLTGGKLAFFDLAQPGDEISSFVVPSPRNGSLTSDFVMDSDHNFWYMNWIVREGGVLVKFDQGLYNQGIPLNDTLQTFDLPEDATTPNGITIDLEGHIWIADTSSSFFFEFDPVSEEFTKYVTTVPLLSTYGNSTGVIKDPVSRPYWSDTDEYGRIVFNEQTGNRLGVFDPAEQLLVEYLIPSQNPHWGDCFEIEECGIAQAFGFAIDGDRIWFTEWAENNIGVLDTSVPLPFLVETDFAELTISQNQTQTLTVSIASNQNVTGEFIAAVTATAGELQVGADTPEFEVGSEGKEIRLFISAGESATPARHKMLVGVEANNVTISKYVTINIE